MKNVLVLNSSISGAQGNSNVLTKQFSDMLENQGPVSLTERDLAGESLPHLTGQEMGAWMTEPEQRSEEQVKLAKISDDLIEELKASDIIVIGMPMYNFGIPSTFKTWIDRIARAGVTFKYTETGPVGLLEGKKVVVIAARGGKYEGTPADTQTPYLQSVLGFVGMTDVSFIYAEGLNMGLKDEAFAQAGQKMAELTEALA